MYYNLDEIQYNYTEWKKPSTREYTHYDSIYTAKQGEMLEGVNLLFIHANT